MKSWYLFFLVYGASSFNNCSRSVSPVIYINIYKVCYSILASKSGLSNFVSEYFLGFFVKAGFVVSLTSTTLFSNPISKSDIKLANIPTKLIKSDWSSTTGSRTVLSYLELLSLSLSYK